MLCQNSIMDELNISYCKSKKTKTPNVVLRSLSIWFLTGFIYKSHKLILKRPMLLIRKTLNTFMLLVYYQILFLAAWLFQCRNFFQSIWGHKILHQLSVGWFLHDIYVLPTLNKYSICQQSLHYFILKFIY